MSVITSSHVGTDSLADDEMLACTIWFDPSSLDFWTLLSRGLSGSVAQWGWESEISVRHTDLVYIGRYTAHWTFDLEGISFRHESISRQSLCLSSRLFASAWLAASAVGLAMPSFRGFSACLSDHHKSWIDSLDSSPGRNKSIYL